MEKDKERDKENNHQTAETFKELGNAALMSSKFKEAIQHYTEAIKLEEHNYILYSNRSYAFLKNKQYYYAHKDAMEVIILNPQWHKGYFRKAEVEYETRHYYNACVSYNHALKCQPQDHELLERLERATKQYLADSRLNEVIPWLGAGTGIIVGVVLMIADAVLTHNPTHPILMAVVTIVIALIGYGIARSYRYYRLCQRDASLEPPLIQVDDQEEDEEEQEDKSDHKEAQKHIPPRYTRSQARQRYKKGKK